MTYSCLWKLLSEVKAGFKSSSNGIFKGPLHERQGSCHHEIEIVPSRSDSLHVNATFGGDRNIWPSTLPQTARVQGSLIEQKIALFTGSTLLRNLLPTAWLAISQKILPRTQKTNGRTTFHTIAGALKFVRIILSEKTTTTDLFLSLLILTSKMFVFLKFWSQSYITGLIVVQ